MLINNQESIIPDQEATLGPYQLGQLAEFTFWSRKDANGTFQLRMRLRTLLGNTNIRLTISSPGTVEP